MKNLQDTLKPYLQLVGDNALIQALVILALSLLAAQITSLFFGRVCKSLTRRTHTTIDDHLIHLLHRPVFITVVLIGIQLAIRVGGLGDPWAKNAHSLLLSIGILVWALFLSRVARMMLVGMSRRHSIRLVRQETLPLFLNATLILIWILAIYLLFSAWGINMTAWLASAGVLGIAVGFGAKDTIANLFGGMFILADAPYKIGDYIVLDGNERGMVTHIGIRSTRLLTRDDVEITIPNSIMVNSKIVNQSGGPHEKFRVRVKVGVAYGSDIDQVKQVLLDVANSVDGVCDRPEPRVRFRQFGESSLDLELLCWVEEPELRGRMLDALNTQVYKQFAQRGIEIPFPQRDLHIKGESA